MSAGGTAPPHDAPPVRLTRIVLIRHGEASCNVAGIVGGPTGCTGLSPVGVREAEALRRRLIDTGELADAGAVYASILPRALETAAIAVAGLGGLEVVPDCGLCELHPGEADGVAWADFADRFGEPDWDVDPDRQLAPGAESWSGFVRRVSSALTSIAARHPGELVVIFCHGGVVEASLEAGLAAAPKHGRLKLRTRHTSLTEWEVWPDRWLLLRYNDAAHLAGVQQA